MNITYPSVQLRNGRRVLAKTYEGELCAVTYANRTQAETSAKVIGGTVLHIGRPFYVEVPADKVEA